MTDKTLGAYQRHEKTTTDPFTETIISDPYAHAHELAVRPGRDADEVRLDATGHGRTVTIVVPAVELRAALDRAAAQEPTDAECLAVLNVAIVPLGEPPKRNGLDDWNPAAVERVRRALSAARAARRDEEKRDG